MTNQSLDQTLGRAPGTRQVSRTGSCHGTGWRLQSPCIWEWGPHQQLDHVWDCQQGRPQPGKADGRPWTGVTQLRPHRQPGPSPPSTPSLSGFRPSGFSPSFPSSFSSGSVEVPLPAQPPGGGLTPCLPQDQSLGLMPALFWGSSREEQVGGMGFTWKPGRWHLPGRAAVKMVKGTASSGQVRAYAFCLQEDHVRTRGHRPSWLGEVRLRMITRHPQPRRRGRYMIPPTQDSSI